HAAANHPDIRAEFYRILFTLQYRAYFVMINKNSGYFKRLKSEKKEHEIFSFSLRRLLRDRIAKNCGDENIFLFERIDLSGRSLSKVLDDLFASIDGAGNCQYDIVDKKEENMAVIDYLNYTLFKVLTTKVESARYRA